MNKFLKNSLIVVSFTTLFNVSAFGMDLPALMEATSHFHKAIAELRTLLPTLRTVPAPVPTATAQHPSVTNSSSLKLPTTAKDTDGRSQSTSAKEDKANDKEKTAAQASTASTTSPTPAVATAKKATKDHENEPKYIFDVDDFRKKGAIQSFKMHNDDIYGYLYQAVAKYILCIGARDNKKLQNENIAFHAHIAAELLKGDDQVDGTADVSAAHATYLKFVKSNYATVEQFEEYLTKKSKMPCYSPTQLHGIPLVQTYKELRALSADVQPKAAYKMLHQAFANYQNALQQPNVISIEKLNALANLLIDFYYAQRIFLEVNNHRHNPYIVKQSNPSQLKNCLCNHFKFHQMLRKDSIAEKDFVALPLLSATYRFNKEVTELSKHSKKDETPKKATKDPKQKSSTTQQDVNPTPPTDAKEKGQATTTNTTNTTTAASIATALSFPSTPFTVRSVSSLLNRSATTPSTSLTSAHLYADTQTPNVEAAKAKATKDHEANDPKYIFDFSEAELAAASRIVELDEGIIFGHMYDAIRTYINSVNNNDKKGLADEDVILNAHIGHLLFKDSQKKDYTKDIEAAYKTHVQLMPKKWKTIDELKAHLTSKRLSLCISLETPLADIPLVHSLTDLRLLPAHIQSKAAFKMMAEAYSKYERALVIKDAPSIPTLNKLANLLIDYYYARMLFLDPNNANIIQNFVTYLNIFGSVEQCMRQHYELDKMFRKHQIPMKSYLLIPYYLAHKKLLQEQAELEKQTKVKNQQKRKLTKREQREKDNAAAQEEAEKKQKDDEAAARQAEADKLAAEKRQKDGQDAAKERKKQADLKKRADRSARSAATKAAAEKKKKEDDAAALAEAQRKKKEAEEKKRQEQLEKNALNALSNERIEAKLAIVDRQLGSYHAESEYGKHYLQQKAKFERELEERKKAAQAAAEKKKKEDEAAEAAEAQRKAAAQKAEQEAKKRAQDTKEKQLDKNPSKQQAEKTATVSEPRQSDHGSKEKQTSCTPHYEQKMPVSVASNADSDSDDDIRSEKWREFREQYVRSYHSSPSGQAAIQGSEKDQKTTSKTSQETSQNHTAEHTTTAVTKQSDLDAKEKQRNAENQKLLRLNRIKALVNPDVDEDCFGRIISDNFFKNNKVVSQKIAYYDFFNDAKFPIRLAISRGDTAEQFIHNLKTAKNTLRWEAYRRLYNHLSSIPEYSSLIGLSPEDMIRNLFKIAHTTPDERLIN